VDRVDEYKHFSKDKTELARELEAMYSAFAERLNFLLDRVIEVTVDGVTHTGLEVIKPGNVAGDDGNWFVSCNSNGDLLSYRKENGSWVPRGMKFKDS
jgi:hypothetical protein